MSLWKAFLGGTTVFANQGQIAQGLAKGPKLRLSTAVLVDSDSLCVLMYSSANATEILSYISVNKEDSKVWGKECLDARCSRDQDSDGS